MIILAGDIGGTKTLLQIAEFDDNRNKTVITEKRYVSADYDDLSDMVSEFLKDVIEEFGTTTIQGACFGIAGPVTGRKGWVTNLTWELDADHMQDILGIAKIRLINDFAAVGYGLEAMGNDDLCQLQAGELEKQGPCVLIGAGTGLGQGILVWQDDHYEVMPSEGGHCDFAPVDAEQVELLNYLMDKFPDHVSYERVCCGRGIVNIYEFLRDRTPAAETDAMKKAMSEGDPAAAVSMAGVAQTDELATQAMHIFAKIYGQQAGNLALTCMASGGVYIAGGIAGKVIKKLEDGTLIEAFNQKGRMHKLTDVMPVNVVLNAEVGLMGAALAASRL